MYQIISIVLVYACLCILIVLLFNYYGKIDSYNLYLIWKTKRLIKTITNNISVVNKQYYNFKMLSELN